MAPRKQHPEETELADKLVSKALRNTTLFRTVVMILLGTNLTKESIPGLSNNTRLESEVAALRLEVKDISRQMANLTGQFQGRYNYQPGYGSK